MFFCESPPKASPPKTKTSAASSSVRFFNLSMAIKWSFGTWLVASITLVSWSGVGFANLTGTCLTFLLLEGLPLSVFFGVFFFGQQVFRACGNSTSPSVWLDRLCVHQTDESRKAAQIAALPIFVARSSHMLILLDDTYCERLWCNLELATFARYGGAENIRVQPLWLAPWLLSSILLDFAGTVLFELSMHAFPNWTSAGQRLAGMLEPFLGESPVLLNFASQVFIVLLVALTYLPSSLPAYFSFRMKLHHHQLMLRQMAEFDVRKAKCTDPTDRTAIMQQVQVLFEEAPASLIDDGEFQIARFAGDSDPLENFNGYVRGKLRDIVISHFGSEHHITWQMSLLAYLPLIFYSTVNVLGCDNAACEESASAYGYKSVTQYVVFQAALWTLAFIVVFPVTYPILLRLLTLALSFPDGPLQRCSACLCPFLAIGYTWLCFGILVAFGVSLAAYYSTTLCVLCLAFLAALVVQVVWLFNTDKPHRLSCRCVKRHMTYERVADP